MYLFDPSRTHGREEEEKSYQQLKIFAYLCTLNARAAHPRPWQR